MIVNQPGRVAGFAAAAAVVPGPPLASEVFPGQDLLVILVVFLLAAALLVLLSVVVVAVARRLWRWAAGAREPARTGTGESLARRLAPAVSDSVPAAEANPERQTTTPEAWPKQASAVLDQYFQQMAALGEAGASVPQDDWVEQVAVRLPGLGRRDEGAS